MAAPAVRARRLAQSYAVRLAELRRQIAVRLERLYGSEVDPDAIAESVARLADQVTPILEAGQASAATLAAAVVGALADADIARADDGLAAIPGTRPDGSPLRPVMAAWGPMILAQVAAGRALADALDYGRHVVSVFADQELVAAADRGTEVAVGIVGDLAGWRGTIDADACDGCTANDGDHPIDWSPYRHGGCHCVVTPIFA